MRKTWTEQGWDDYLYWQTQDKKTLRRINDLVKDIERNGVANGIRWGMRMSRVGGCAYQGWNGVVRAQSP